MSKKVFTIYDEKAEAFLQPFFAETFGIATRIVSDLVNDPSHQFCRHASDFTLFHIANFDERTGEFEIFDKKSMGCLVEHRQAEKNLTLIEGGSEE